jgi:hypothetical protein
MERAATGRRRAGQEAAAGRSEVTFREALEGVGLLGLVGGLSGFLQKRLRTAFSLLLVKVKIRRIRMEKYTRRYRYCRVRSRWTGL